MFQRKEGRLGCAETGPRSFLPSAVPFYQGGKKWEIYILCLM